MVNAREWNRVTRYWGGEGGTRHFFFLKKKIGGGRGGHVPPGSPAPRSMN